jgi:hypothetical protein
VASLLRASPSRSQQLAPPSGSPVFVLADFAEMLPGSGELQIWRVRAILAPRVFEVLIGRENDHAAPLNRLANGILAGARLPIVDPIRGDAVHCFQTAGQPEWFT